jgi:two-component system phosphate regulon sensor histidine kinase PhoR
MQDRQITRVIILGVFAIITLTGLQSYWVINTWNLNEEEFNEKITRVLIKVARSLAELNAAELPQRNLIRRRSSNYFIVNIDNEIDPPMLEFFLQRELESAALQLDFDYAVFDCTSNQMVYGAYCSFDPGKQAPEKVQELPAHQGFTYYFGVRFPTRTSYLFGKTKLVSIFTGLILLTIAFFAFAMVVILRQKRLTEMQKDFINNMTHEFKTPIATAQIAAGVLMEAPEVGGNPRLHRYASIIREQNARLNQQVERILEVARFERNQFELKKDFFSLKNLMNEVAQSELLRVQEKGGTLECLTGVQDIEVFGDRLHFGNVLYSLVDNSIKYSRGGPEICLEAKIQGEYVAVRVTDGGIGIAKEHLPFVFDQFYRVPTGNVHNVKGFGLGLYYAKRICVLHRWKIEIESNPGRGTVVTIYIKQTFCEGRLVG